MKTLEAPDTQKSYVTLDRGSAEIDEQGLPLVYDKDAIQAYWTKERGALNRRWGEFVGKAVPFLTKMVGLFIRDGTIVEKEIPELSRQARIDRVRHRFSKVHFAPHGLAVVVSQNHSAAFASTCQVAGYRSSRDIKSEERDFHSLRPTNPIF